METMYLLLVKVTAQMTCAYSVTAVSKYIKKLKEISVGLLQSDKYTTVHNCT